MTAAQRKAKQRKLRPELRDLEKAWQQKNKEKINSRRRTRYLTEPLYRLRQLIRARIQDAIGRKTKLHTTRYLLGCSIAQLKTHLESLFLPGMSWVNRQLWHIDHVKPVSSFYLSTLEGQQAAFHYTNCQPLWALDNLRKGARI